MPRLRKIIKICKMKNRNKLFETHSEVYTQIQRQMLMKRRRSRKKQVRQSFNCSCGKVYLSFSAIYLHARRKHNIKLSTIQNHQGYITEEKKGYVKHIYLVNQLKGKKNQDSLKDTQMELLELPQQEFQNSSAYPSQLKEYLQNLPTLREKRLVHQLLNFVFPQTWKNQKQTEQKIYELPYYLNPFLLEYIPNHYPQFSLSSKQGRKACKILKKFCNWLNETKMTDLQVLKNHDC